MATPKKSAAPTPPTVAEMHARLAKLQATLPEVPVDPPRPTTAVLTTAIGTLTHRAIVAARAEPEVRPFARTTLASRIKREPVSWLWPGRIPNRISFFMGMVEQGKSTLMSHLASVITTGGAWPDCPERCEAGSVILIQSEESRSEDIAARLESMGADTDRLHYLDDIDPCDGRRARRFNIGTDCDPLEDLIETIGDVRAVIVDPFDSFLGKVNTRSTEDVYEALIPLKDMAERVRVAMILVAHPNKNDEQNIVHRLAGSQAFGAISRAFWFISEDPNDPTRRMMSCVKGNPRGMNKRPIAFALADDQLVFDTECGDMRAKHVEFLLQRNLKEESLRARRNGRAPSSSVEAVALILAALAGGPMLRAGLKKLVVSDKIGESSFNKALNSLEEEGKVFRRHLPTSRKCVLVGLAEHDHEGSPGLPFGGDADRARSEPEGGGYTPDRIARDPILATNGYGH